jgi:hypothetical protein
MAIIEIRILSGARQGERIELDCKELRVGADPACDVRFDPQTDPSVKDRAAEIRLAEDGWHLRSLASGEILLNHQPVTGSLRIRSGDVVRMSERGPDFVFGILAHPSGVAASLPHAAATLPATVESAPQPIPVSQPVAAAAAGGSHSLAIILVCAVVGVAVLAVVGAGLLVLGWLMFDSSTYDSKWHEPPVIAVEPPEVPDESTAEKPEKAEKAKGTQGSNVAPHQSEPGRVGPEGPGRHAPARIGDPGIASPKGNHEPEKPEAAKNGWPAVLQQVRGAVLVLEVEEPKGRAAWPLATCCAIRDDTLLTSGSVVSDLAGFQKKGWKLWAHGQTAGAKREVRRVRVHKGFRELAEEPVKRIYFDLGLLTVEGKLPKTVPLATPEELADVDKGMPVAVIGIPHEGDAVSRFQPLVPELWPGKVFITTVLEQTASSPRLLHVMAPLPANLSGCPVVDRQGHVIGVYAVAAAPPEGVDAKGLNLQYVVDTRLVNLWLAGGNDPSWVPPDVPEGPAKPAPATKPDRKP